MSAIDFTKKGLNQVIFSKSTFNASSGKNSSAFKSIMSNKKIAHVVDKFGEKKVFYDALKKRAMSSDKYGITKNDFKKVLGDIEHSGKFSHHEMMDLRENLVGGPVSSSIIREYGSRSQVDNKSSATGRSVDMRSIYREIMDKGSHGKSLAPERVGGNVSHNVPVKATESNVLHFRSNSNIRNAEGLIAKPVENRHHLYDSSHANESEDDAKTEILRKLHDIQS